MIKLLSILKESNFLSIFALFIGCLLFFSYFLLNTESRYKYSPLGDAKIYTLMSINYNNPKSIKEPLPALYTVRMLPSFIVGLFSSWQLKEENVDKITYLDAIDFQKYWHVNGVIRSNFLILNFFANFSTVCLLYLIFTHLKFSRLLSIGLALSFMTFFIPVRLYVCWPQMADPFGFMVLSAMFYSFIKSRFKIFLTLAILGVMVRENTLFLIPCFWLYIFSLKISIGKRVGYFTFSLLPIILFFCLRIYPYFPSQISIPNSQFRIPFQVNLLPPLGLIADYIYILSYHFNMSNSLWIRTLLIPFYTFSIFGILLLIEGKETINIAKKYFYFFPFILISFFVGIAIDRQFFYLFPIVFIIIGHILNKNLLTKRSELIFLLIIFAINFYLYDHFIPITARNILFADMHQLEYIFSKRELLNTFFKVVIMGIIGIFSYIFLKNKKGVKVV